MKNMNSKKGFFRVWKKLRLWVKIAILVIFIGLLGLAYRGVSEFIQYLNHDYFSGSEYAEDAGDKLNSDCQDVICDFLNQFYYAQAKLPEEMDYSDYDQSAIDSYVPDMTDYFTKPDGKAAKVWQSSLRFLITASAISPVDLSLSDIKYSLEYLSVDQKENSCKVVFTETAKFKFAFLDDMVSESYKMPCEISLKKVDGDWKISSYYREDDFALVCESSYESLVDKGYSKSKAANDLFEDCLKHYIATLEKKEAERENFNNGLVSYDDVTYDVAYDRQAAYEYAIKYVKERNDSDWGVYDELGGNCQNFGSQVLYTGGIPMDLEGDKLWKYYGDDVDETSSKYGRTTSWTGAPFFYHYAKGNEGFGLVATVDANMFSAEAGDILQVGPNEGEMDHTNVVIDRVLDGDEVVDIIINSNTKNRVNWPMYAFFTRAYSLIKIHGYNK